MPGHHLLIRSVEVVTSRAVKDNAGRLRRRGSLLTAVKEQGSKVWNRKSPGRRLPAEPSSSRKRAPCVSWDLRWLVHPPTTWTCINKFNQTIQKRVLLSGIKQWGGKTISAVWIEAKMNRLSHMINNYINSKSSSGWEHGLTRRDRNGWKEKSSRRGREGGKKHKWQLAMGEQDTLTHTLLSVVAISKTQLASLSTNAEDNNPSHEKLCVCVCVSCCLPSLLQVAYDLPAALCLHYAFQCVKSS